MAVLLKCLISADVPEMKLILELKEVILNTSSNTR